MKVFLPGNRNSYRKISEAPTAPVEGHGSQLLLWLEVLRNTKATLTTLLKEALYIEGDLTHKQRYTAESPMSFQEPQGANAADRDDWMMQLQLTSIIRVLEGGIKDAPDKELGNALVGKTRTTAKKLNTALQALYNCKGNKKQKLALKRTAAIEVNRLIRAVSGVPWIESDEESEMSETEVDNKYGT